MDIPQVLAVLCPGEDWGPNANSDSTYDQLAATWRSAVSECPTEAAMEAKWAELEAGRAAARLRAQRAAAVAAIFTATDPTSIAVRAFVDDIYTQLNNLRELLPAPLPREQREVIIGRVETGIGGGLGDAPG